MPRLEYLTLSSMEIKNLQMQAEGYCLWIVWSGELNPLVNTTLEEYGGIAISSEENQSLWFFFSNNICLAGGRLIFWARFNPIPVTLQLFPATVQVGESGEKKVIVDSAIQKQEIKADSEFQVWAHPGVVKASEGVLGISYTYDEAPVEGMSSTKWALMRASSRMPFNPAMGWFVILRPVGRPADKKFQLGWHDFLPHLEALLQRNKLRYTIKDYFLMLPLEGGLKRLRDWCKDFLVMINQTRAEETNQYWPCVMAIIDKNQLNFSDELHEKVDLDWKQLAPDFPHMLARNAFMLGEEFSVQAVRFAPNRHTPDDWCTVSFKDSTEKTESNLPNLMSEISLGNFPHCFYCGQRSHESKDCPTKHLPEYAPETWQQLAFLDFETMSEAVAAINKVFQKKGPEIIQSLYKKDNANGLFLRALFGINWAVQLRSVNSFWRAKNKDLKDIEPKPKSEESSAAITALNEFNDTDFETREKTLSILATRFPKDFRIMSLRGFDAMERGDWNKASSFWKEAEMASPYPVVAAWHLLLQARCLEIQNMLFEASLLYDSVSRKCPSWSFVPYRKIVCDVKSGFSNLVIPSLINGIENDGNYYNQTLIDPEIERGYIQIFDVLNRMWAVRQEEAKKETINLKRILGDLPNWFIPEHEFSQKIAERINTLLQMGSVHNYVALQALVQGRSKVERDLQKFVNSEGRNLRDAFKQDYARLEYIKEEAAWFPFPSSLKEFNKKFNESVVTYNWVLKANLQLPEPFKNAQMLLEEQRDRLKYLEKKMRFLRIIRDATLFFLAVAELFIKIEIFGLILIFGIIPFIFAYGGSIGLGWTSNILRQEQFYVQKVFFLLLSIFAFGVSTLRCLLRFEQIREKVFAKAKAASKEKKRVKKK